MQIYISYKQIIEYTLRIGVFLTFIGHGIYAIMGKPEWLDYLIFVGFKLENASIILNLIGYIDIVIACFILLKPNKYILLWATIWAFSTALIRPISGESILEFIERGANWLCPLALFFYYKYMVHEK